MAPDSVLFRHSAPALAFRNLSMRSSNAGVLLVRGSGSWPVLAVSYTSSGSLSVGEMRGVSHELDFVILPHSVQISFRKLGFR